MAWWGVCGMQGWRMNMEDAHISEEVHFSDGSKGLLFGVFDGHGGSEVAAFAKSNFKRILGE